MNHSVSDALPQLLDSFPVFRTLEDALHRDPLSPAWCLLPAPLVEPLLRLIGRLPSALPEGELVWE